MISISARVCSMVKSLCGMIYEVDDRRRSGKACFRQLDLCRIYPLSGRSQDRSTKDLPKGCRSPLVVAQNKGTIAPYLLNPYCTRCRWSDHERRFPKDDLEPNITLFRGSVPSVTIPFRMEPEQGLTELMTRCLISYKLGFERLEKNKRSNSMTR